MLSIKFLCVTLRHMSIFGGLFFALDADHPLRFFQRLFYPILVVLDIDEIAVDLVDGLHNGKCMIVFRQNIAKFDELALVDDAEEHVALRVAVSAHGGNFRGAVFEVDKDLALDLGGVRGDDEELVSRLRPLDDAVAHHAREEAVEHTQAHGFVFVEHTAAAVGLAVHKVGGDGDDGVDGEIDPEEIEHGVLLADEFGDDVRSPRGGVAAEGDAVDVSPHRPRDEGGEDGIHPLRVVLEAGDGGSDRLRLQYEQRHRIDDGEDERLDGKSPVDEEEGEKTERHVDDEREVPDGKARLVLDHGGDAVESRRRELVLDDKEHIIEGKDERQHDHDGRIEHGSPRELFFHRFPPILFLKLYHIPARKSRGKGKFSARRSPLSLPTRAREKFMRSCGKKMRKTALKQLTFGGRYYILPSSFV